MLRYNFHDPSVPSFAKIANRVARDGALDDDNRRELVVALSDVIELPRQLPRFTELDAEALPFTSDVLAGLGDALTTESAADEEVALLTMLCCRRVLHMYGLAHPPQWMPYTPEIAHLRELLPASYRRRNIDRLLRFASAGRADLYSLTEADMRRLRRALAMDPSVKHPDILLAQMRRAWDWAAATIPGWPPQRVEAPVKKRWANPWSDFPDTLYAEADESLSTPPRFGRKRRLSTKSYHFEMELVRICASVLAQSGVPIAAINGVRALVIPEHYCRILDGLFQRAGGQVTRLARTKAIVLRKIARSCDQLTTDELREVEAAFDTLEKEHKIFLKRNPARSQLLLEDYTEPRVVDALLRLPGEVLGSLAGQRLTRTRARTAKCAAILSLWLEAPLTSSQLRGLRFDAHFAPVMQDGQETLLLSIPAGELGNHIQLQYLLSEPVSRLLIQYRTNYRHKLALTPSPYLFPGLHGRILNSGTLNFQMKRFLAKELKTRFTPELIRRIATMIAFEEDPAAIEAVRGMLGHRTDEMARAAAKSFVKRTHHATYLELLVDGQLGGFDAQQLRGRVHDRLHTRPAF
jgi:hypothetical protein